MSKKYEISIAQDAEINKMVKQLGSRNRAEFDAAMEAVAAFIGDVVLNVVDQAPVISNLFTTVTYNDGAAPSLPLDVYYDIRDRGFIQVWSQSAPGGLATNQVHGLNELMVTTYEVDSAVSMSKRYAREARLDVLAATIERMAGEFLVKQETDSANIISAALGQSTYTPVGGGAAVTQGIRVGTANYFGLDDFNRLITLLQRIRPSWVGGTPVGGNVVSHLVGSPEFHEQLRSIAYQPQNTRDGKLTTSGASSLSAPESVRSQVFDAAGNPTFYGVELLNVYEMGVGQPYNTLFDNYIGATTVGGSAFDGAADEIVWGLSLSANKRALTRLVKTGENGILNVMPDDSFPMRSEKLGWYSRLEEGRVILDSRNLAYIVI